MCLLRVVLCRGEETYPPLLLRSAGSSHRCHPAVDDLAFGCVPEESLGYTEKML